MLKWTLFSLYILALTVQVALADAPVIWNGTGAKWLPSGLKSAGVCVNNASGVMSIEAKTPNQTASTICERNASGQAFFAGVGVGSNSLTSGTLLDVTGTTGGLGVPVLTDAQRNALTVGKNGVLIWNSDNLRFEYYNGGWAALSFPSLPLSIPNGGTGQGNAFDAFNALSPMTTLGDTIYYGSGPAGAYRLAGNTTTTQKFLAQTGDGVNSAAPSWVTLSSSDIPALNYVSSISVASANGFAGSSSGGTTPSLTLSTSVTGMLKGNGTAISAAVANTDYLPATTGSAIQKADGSGGLTAASAGTDYAPATSGTSILKGNGSGGFSAAVSGTDYAPATSGTGYLKGDGSGGFSSQAVPIPVADGGTGQTSYTDGQLLIGNTATGGLSKATLTAGSGVTITNGNGTISIAASGSSGGGQYIGSITYAGTSNCNWTQASSGSFANFSADTDCPTPTTVGSVSAPATKIPGVDLTIGADYATSAYMFVAHSGRFYLASGASDTCAMRFSDGTNSSAMQTVAISTSPVTTNWSGVIVFGSSGSKTVQIQGRVSAGADNCNIDASASARDFTIDVYKFSY